ncbi:glycoside hydrolase family 37 protein [Trichoderma citrinoviride]|uniref:Trehalase n=1 Tax=Trichoderma citrinoviride TaxID=58853 RepID=A0A2T4AZU7_9HYPO|nr:glycoside hydrolase family 37 protein [Trichoderma citrinoviride]PTB62595.1 glycoside hydrolase family 37 protein [Trichoderma citrinoviride]
MAAAAFIHMDVAHALYINGSVIAPCDSPIYCHGDILREIELAHPFSDSKTFVDMPAKRPLSEIQAAFAKLPKPLTNSSSLQSFLATYFADAGGELVQVPRANLSTNPSFLSKINDTVLSQFVTQVIDIWPDLTRRYAGDAAVTANCSSCPNSFIPVNRTFVVAGGRFREPYYWDSYWIVEGLLRTGGAFVGIAKNTIENFCDFIGRFGFVPNGARLYYLNRSQPPLLSRMVKVYVEHTNDTSILRRALPLLVQEHDFWTRNRTADVRLASNNKTYVLQQYAVQNTQPRPESFREDFQTANNRSYFAASGIIYPETKHLNGSQMEDLYANLATGAESGNDYTARWLADPSDAMRDVYFPLRSLNNKDIVPVDLNAILYGNELIIAQLFNQTGNTTAAREWSALAANRSASIQAVFWNETLFSYFDYNLTSGSQNIYVPLDKDAVALDRQGAPPGQQVLFHVGQFYPLWTGAAPEYLRNNPFAVTRIFDRVKSYLDTRPGGIPASNVNTGQQWDQPNVWPPHMHILMESLNNVPATFSEADPAYQDVRNLSLRLAQRYLDFTFCTWRATGGSTSETPKLQGLTDQDVGIMFEKYNDNSTNAAGGGGEYEVVEGFGWTNGVLLWTADTFGSQLKRPQCGNITAGHPAPSKRSAVQLDTWDASRVKKFGRRAEGRMGRLDAL